MSQASTNNQNKKNEHTHAVSHATYMEMLLHMHYHCTRQNGLRNPKRTLDSPWDFHQMAGQTDANAHYTTHKARTTPQGP